MQADARDTVGTDTTASQGGNSPRRFWADLKHGRLPIAAVLIAFIATLTIGVAFLAWGLTYAAASSSATTLGNSLENNILKRILSDVTFKLRSAEESVEHHILNWRRGFYNASTPAQVDTFLQLMHNSMVPRVELFTSSYFTSVPAGEMNGANYNPQTQVWNHWRHTNDTYQVITVNAAGDFIEAAPPQPGLNFITDFLQFGGAFWVDIVNITDTTSRGWTQVYPIERSLWKSYSGTVFDHRSVPVGVQSADMSAAFVADFLEGLSENIPYNNVLYAFEVQDDKDIVLASSIKGSLYVNTDLQDPTDPASGMHSVMTMADVAATDANVQGLSTYIAQHSGGTLKTFLANLPRDFSVDLKLPGGTFTMQIGEVNLGVANLHWAFVILISRNDVMAELQSSNKKAIGIIAAVVAAGCVLVMAYAFLLARAMLKIARDLKLLAAFKFQDVMQQDMDKETGLRRPKYSRIQELWRIQRAFHQMVVNFAGAVSQNRSFGDRAGGRRSTLQGATASNAPAPNIGSAKRTSKIEE
ncbi:hypothetical protein PhCBS80983_g04041 [Powellomyces hirtus]|uniref:Uncharacterized protein n=1 Tax=Powellomyces hirtus TaxID=109895 RepID=A0A507DZV3_9FUNG|nr:hypothetical protein PhCBS80983_g04041 [Powellomyces hirtus]